MFRALSLSKSWLILLCLFGPTVWADDPVTDPSARLSTRDLETYLWERVYGDEEFDWEIDDFTAARHLNIVPAEGEEVSEAMTSLAPVVSAA